jgi:hypothetical protein
MHDKYVPHYIRYLNVGIQRAYITLLDDVDGAVIVCFFREVRIFNSGKVTI